MRVRDQRGLVFPSPVVMLSVIAVAMAGIAFVATRGQEPTEREVAIVSREQTPAADPTTGAAPGSGTKATPEAKEKPKKKRESVVQRGEVYVEVYNNSGITGLAGQVAAEANAAGWQVVGSDNWYGTIPTTTVYYPESLERAAKMLALDLGIERRAPAIDPMRLDRLTLILTAPPA